MKIKLGALDDALSIQLKDTELPDKDLEHLDKDQDALIRCYIRNLITESSYRAGQKKLIKTISQELKKVKKNG